MWECAKAVSIPIVGIGGITTIEDARKFFLAGATAIQVGTALYARSGFPERIIDALEANPEWIHSARSPSVRHPRLAFFRVLAAAPRAVRGSSASSFVKWSARLPHTTSHNWNTRTSRIE